MDRTDQIRDLKNEAVFAGKLLELTNVREGVNSAGVGYISYRGVIQYDENNACTQRFSAYVKANKSNGDHSKLYDSVKKWVASAVPATEDPENPTFVELKGSLIDNPYVNKDDKLIEAVEFRAGLINPFKSYKAEINIEGFVHSYKEETRGEESEPTGRMKMRLISRDMFHNTIDITHFIIEQDLYAQMEATGGAFDRGCTTTFYISLKPRVVASSPRGGIGVTHVSTNTYTDWVVTGADMPYSLDSANALSSKVVKDAMTERQSKLEEIKNNGYLGNKESTASRPGIGGVSTATVNQAMEVVEFESATDDDDFPF